MVKNLFSKVRKNKYTLLMIVITIIFGVQMYMSIQSETSYLDDYIKRNTDNISNLIHVSIHNKEKVTKTLFELDVDHDIATLLAKAKYASTSDKDDLRLDLMDAFLPIYNEISSLGIRQFQFHLADGTSFLRLHKPAKYNDDLLAFRETIQSVQKYKVPFHGFEEGRGSNGYRYVLPIFRNQTFVGSVEYSYTMSSIVKPVLNTYSLEGILIMDKVEVETKSLNNISSNYIEDTIFNKGYLDKSFPTDELASKLQISETQFQRLNEQINRAVLKDHTDNEAFTYIMDDQNLYWAYTYDVYDFSEKKVGTLVFYKNDPVLFEMVQHLEGSRLYTISTTSLLFVLLIISYFFFMKTNRQAVYDSLTKLYNRYYFNNFVEDEKIEGALLIMDIDDFKLVNDRYGHDVGDKVLKSLSEIIQNNTRSTDVAMRWGGEEFMIILSDMTPEDSLSKSLSLLKVIENHDFFGIHLTASIGIALLGKDKEMAIKKADQALYYVKKNGKNNAVIYNEGMNYE